MRKLLFVFSLIAALLAGNDAEAGWVYFSSTQPDPVTVSLVSSFSPGIHQTQPPLQLFFPPLIQPCY